MSRRYYVGTSTFQERLGVGLTGTGTAVTTWTAAPTYDWADLRAAVVTSCLGLGVDGTLFGWGLNYSYALGLGDTSYRASPTAILTGVASFAALSYGGLAVKTDGTLWAWGTNNYDELGFGDATLKSTPTQVGALTTWAKVAGGDLFSLAIKTDGTLWSAGANSFGATGQGTGAGQTTTWTQVGSFTDWEDIQCGDACAVALRNGGVLYAWGDGQAFDGTDVLAPATLGSGTWIGITAGQYNIGAWKSDGSVYVIGVNYYGQLGIAGDPITTLTVVPTLVADSVHMARGFAGTVIFTTGGDMFATGDNSSYLLGLPSATNYTTFTQVTGVSAGFAYVGYSGSAQLLIASAPEEDVTEGVGFADGITTMTTVTEDVSEAGATGDTWADFPIRFIDYTDSANGADTFADLIYTMWLERLHAATPLAGGAVTHDSILDSARVQDIAQQAISQIMSESANGADIVSLGATGLLLDIATLAGVYSPTFTAVMSVAELLVAIETLNGADGYDVAETSDAADAIAQRVDRMYAMLEERYIQDVNEAYVIVNELVTETPDIATTTDYTGSIINALLSDVTLITVRLNIGGELYTGWVLNTDTLAPSEYQFADRQFNSACRHGNKYLMASEDGIYEFTEDVGVESVMTYIKTGKSDFGSDLKKRIVNSYIVYSATGNMVLKVTTSEYGQLQTRNYRMVPPSNSETTDVRRFDIGRGVKSRYWQFELVGDGVDCDIDEIGMLPVVLSRRI